MMKISEVAGSELKWVPKLKGFELKRGEDVVGTLKFRSMFGTFATGETGDGAWTFKRIGFFRTAITIRNAATDTEVAVFRNSTWSGGGTLELPDGGKYKADTNFFETKLAITDEREAPLVYFRNTGLLRSAAAVEIAPSALSVPELPLLVILGFYLMIMISRDSAANA